jgi:hypothetical protein
MKLKSQNSYILCYALLVVNMRESFSKIDVYLYSNATLRESYSLVFANLFLYHNICYALQIFMLSLNTKKGEIEREYSISMVLCV